MINEKSYQALAQAYDALMYDVDYDAWAAYLDGILRARGVKKIAEVACGTGNITYRLKKMGYAVTAVDRSEEMLRIAEKKGRELGCRVPLIRQDMRYLELPPQQAILSCCDGVNYLLEEEDVMAFFKSAYACLKREGWLLFDMSTLYKMQHVLGDQLFFDDGEEISCFWQNHFHDGRVEMNLTLFIKDGELYRRADETQVQAAYSVEQMIGWMKDAGFRSVKAVAFLSEKLPAPDAQRVQFIAQK